MMTDNLMPIIFEFKLELELELELEVDCKLITRAKSYVLFSEQL